MIKIIWLILGREESCLDIQRTCRRSDLTNITVILSVNKLQ